MGLVPVLTEPGDAICLLPSARAPFILRIAQAVEEKKYELIGDCYIRELMKKDGAN